MGIKIQTIRDTRVFLFDELPEIYDEPEKTAIINLILKTLFGNSRLHQIYISDKVISPGDRERIIQIACELKTGKPIQYVLGETTFYDCVIKVSPATLIPRPETEELVQLIINENPGYNGSIIDFGTGSGCIAIALASNLKDAHVTGVDISEDAILIATENASRNKVEVKFTTGDILNFNCDINEKPGIIVSNPPYVRISEKKYMQKNVLDFEPGIALFVTDDEPLIFYHALLEIASRILLPGGYIYFEINEVFGKSIAEMAAWKGFSNVRIICDLNGKDRFIKGTLNG